jgi:hypothetical protein
MRKSLGLTLNVGLLLLGWVTHAAAAGLRYQIVSVPTPHAELIVQFAPAVLEALEASVPLSFTFNQDQRSSNITLSYAPLFEQFELNQDGRTRYFRLRAELLDAFATIASANQANAPQRLRVRLDFARMPAAMRIPALFDRDWRLDTGWQVLAAKGAQ